MNHNTTTLGIHNDSSFSRNALDKLVGVSDARIVRLLSAIGAVGNILSSYGEGSEKISVVLWDHNAAAQAKVAKRAKVSLDMVRYWLHQDLPKTYS